MKKLEIVENDLVNNINIIKKIVTSNDDKTKIIAVVKANGIGLDLIKFSQVLIKNGINILAVAQAKEAIKLRKEANIQEEIIMLSPCIDEEDLQLLLENDITLTIGNLEELNLIENLAKKINKEHVNVHIKIDTGFSRYGFLYNDIENILGAFKSCKLVKILGTYTHFSKPIDEKWTREQFNRFMECVENIKNNGFNPGMLHCASSTAVLKYPEMKLDAVRIGSIFQGRTLLKVDNLLKIGTFKTSIVEIKNIPKGYNISYGNTYKTKRDTKIAIIPVGYMDGLNKEKLIDDFSFKNKLISVGMEIKKLFKDNSLKVGIKGQKYKIIGRLGMYHSIIDITDETDIEIGEEVILDIKPLQANDEIRREYI